MKDEQIKVMVDRFLSWKLPDDFNPDGGISFQQIANPGTISQFKRVPTGTNLFTATQAEAMVRHMLGGIDLSSSPDIRAAMYAIGREKAVNYTMQNERGRMIDLIEMEMVKAKSKDAVDLLCRLGLKVLNP